MVATILLLSENGIGCLHRRVRQRLDGCRGLFCIGPRISRVPSKYRFHDDAFFVFGPHFDFEPMTGQTQIRQMICQYHPFHRCPLSWDLKCGLNRIIQKTAQIYLKQWFQDVTLIPFPPITATHVTIPFQPIWPCVTSRNHCPHFKEKETEAQKGANLAQDHVYIEQQS